MNDGMKADPSWTPCDLAGIFDDDVGSEATENAWKE